MNVDALLIGLLKYNIENKHKNILATGICLHDQAQMTKHSRLVTSMDGIIKHLGVKRWTSLLMIRNSSPKGGQIDIS